MQPQFPTLSTQRSQPVMSEEALFRQPLESTLKQIARDLAFENSQEPTDALLLVLSKTFLNQFVFLLELAPSSSPHPHSHRLILASRGELWTSATFELQKSACEAALDHGPLSCVRGARSEFPSDSLLAGLEIESLLACPVQARGGQPMGVFGVLGRHELGSTSGALETIFQIYASHMAAAIDCHRARQLLREEKERTGTVEARIKRNNLESLGTAAGEIAHDFNNLLTVVLGNLSLALRSRGLDTHLYEQLTAAKLAGLRAHELAQQLHSFAEAAAPIKARAAIGELVRETVGFFLPHGGVPIQITTPDELWSADIDRAQIGQALHNVSLYAQKCLPAMASLEVACSNATLQTGDSQLGLEAGDYVVIRFQKEGTEPCALLQNQGSDLSVIAARSIIQGHGGLLKSDPRSRILFEIFLPAVPEKALVPFPVPVGTLEGARVLVADDEEALCELLADALAPFGCEVCSTQDGSHALSLYQNALDEGRRFDVVITDLHMPSGIGGLELVRGLHSLDPDVRVIVSSGHATDAVVVYYREHGFCGVLTKPYDLASLERVIAAAMLPGAALAEGATTSEWRAFPTTHALLA